ncbi:MAG: folylpolyglutamate synthase/dihydrofolate synthase family protein [Pseudomonadota bacterium]
MPNETPVEKALASLRLRRPSLIDLGLSRMHATLDALGNPHFNLPPVFHVAGTNGKGSTVSYIRSILEASGASVHVYTSPHLVSFNERIVLRGEKIGDDPLIETLERVDRAAGDAPLSFFEAATTAAFLVFSETPADYLVLEVGLGGRLDATNVLERPISTTITPIALDHQEYLGDTLAKIATEKAGIFRQGVPAVVGPQAPEAMAAIESACDEAQARRYFFGSGWDARVEHGRLIFQDEDGLSDLAPPRLLGAHQADNAALAVASVKAAGVKLDDETMSAGLENAFWPARLQRLVDGPIVDRFQTAFPAGVELWLDGGHNPHAARAIATAFSDLEEKASAPLIMIVGIQNNKDSRGYFTAFEGLASKVFAVQSNSPNAATPEDVAAAAKGVGIAAEACASIDDAIAKAASIGGGPMRILIGGSLYLAGEILRRNA